MSTVCPTVRPAHSEREGCSSSCAPNYAAAEIEGIEGVDLLDIQLCRDLGYRIKLVASADRSPDGVLVRVHPSLAPLDHPWARAGGALNALFIEGTRIGRIFVQGPGAGSGPTAAAESSAHTAGGSAISRVSDSRKGGGASSRAAACARA